MVFFFFFFFAAAAGQFGVVFKAAMSAVHIIPLLPAPRRSLHTRS
jgi:hypothetical protein